MSKLALKTIIAFAAICPIVSAHTGYTGYSGAPGSNGTCTSSCHSQYSFVPSVRINGFPEVYEANHRYTISVYHDSGAAINQFNTSVRIGQSSDNAGTLAVGYGTQIYNTTNETNGVRWTVPDSDSGTFIWTSPEAGTGEVRLYWAGLQGSRYNGVDTQIVLIATEPISSVDYLPGTPTIFSLKQNYPNPFNEDTIIELNIAEPSDINFIITNILGQLVYEWRKEQAQTGTVNIRWDGRSADGRELPTGVYFYRLRSKAGTITKKMMLMR